MGRSRAISGRLDRPGAITANSMIALARGIQAAILPAHRAILLNLAGEEERSARARIRTMHDELNGGIGIYRTCERTVAAERRIDPKIARDILLALANSIERHRSRNISVIIVNHASIYVGQHRNVRGRSRRRRLRSGRGRECRRRFGRRRWSRRGRRSMGDNRRLGNGCWLVRLRAVLMSEQENRRGKAHPKRQK